MRMKAYVMQAPGGIEVLEKREIPRPEARKGWILIEIKAFGLNRSELMTRQGHSGDAVRLPRVLGIECVGIVRNGGGTDLKEGQKVAAAMGAMGRQYDGSYAEYTLVPRSNVYPLETDLDWASLAALPETYLTAWGVSIEAVELKKNQSLLIRGGTSSVGMAALSIAKDLNCTVIATTRQEEKIPLLEKAGADHIILDRGRVQEQVREIFPTGVGAVVELVGRKNTILDGLQCIQPKGTLGMVGFLGNEWDYGFFPWMPSTVKLTLYNSETLETNFATPVLQKIVDKVASGEYDPHIYQTYSFEELAQAQKIMENSAATGKLVILI